MTRPAADIFPTGYPRASGYVASDTAAGTVTGLKTVATRMSQCSSIGRFRLSSGAPRACPQRSPVSLTVVFATLRRQEVLNDEARDVTAQPLPGGEVEAEMNPREDTTERGS